MLTPPSEIKTTVDKTFRYAVRRGLLAALAVHPFYRALQQLSEAEAGGRVKLKIPRLLRGLIFPFSILISIFFPFFKFDLTFQNNILAVSFDLRWWAKVIRRSFPASLRSVVDRRIQELNEQIRASYGIKSTPERPLMSTIFLLSLWGSLVILLNIPLYLALTLFRGLSTTLSATLRAVPALLAILVVVFITGDTWKLFGPESAWRFFALMVIIAAISIAVTIGAFRGPEGNWRSVTGYSLGGAKLLESWADRKPAKRLITSGVKPFLPPEPSTQSQGKSGPYLKIHEMGISVLYMLTLISQVFAVAFWVSFTFIVIGLVTVSKSFTGELSDSSPDIILHFSIGGQPFIVTRQLILVSVVLGGIAALTFASGTLQDTDKRRTFTDNALIDLKHALGALAYYYGVVLALLLKLSDSGVIAQVGGQPAVRLATSLGHMAATAGINNENSTNRGGSGMYAGDSVPPKALQDSVPHAGPDSAGPG